MAKDGEKTVQITEAELDARIAAAAEAGARAGAESAIAAFRAMPQAAPAPTLPNPETNEGGQYERILKALKGTPAPAEKEPFWARSPLTGAAFRVRVDNQGVIRNLLDYTYPIGSDVHEEDGGLVPNGAPIKDDKGGLDPHFKQWRWTTFWQADLRTYIDKPHAKLARMLEPFTPETAPDKAAE